jgi:hypothetical protein
LLNPDVQCFCAELLPPWLHVQVYGRVDLLGLRWAWEAIPRPK